MIHFESNSMVVYQPRFGDAQRTRIKAIVRVPDGRYIEMEAACSDLSNPFVRDVFAQYKMEEIAKFSAHEAEVLERKRVVEQQAGEDRRVAEDREIAFQAKTKALELPEVINCPDRRIARKIRRSQSAFEVAGWLAVAFMRSLEIEDALEAMEGQRENAAVSVGSGSENSVSFGS